MRIACLATKLFEDSELTEPVKAMRDAEHEVLIVSPTRDEIVGYKGIAKVKPDLTIDEARPEDFDAIFVPGGFSPDQLRADDRFVEFVRGFDELDRPILAICHGPQLLLAGDVLDGRTVTAWKTVQDDLRRCGVDVRNEEVVVDDQLVTSRMPGDLPAFNQAILRILSQAPIASGTYAAGGESQPSA